MTKIAFTGFFLVILAAACNGLAGCSSIEEAGDRYVPGVYEGTGRGERGMIAVLVRVDGERIMEIEILENEEDPFIGSPAMESLAETAAEENSADLDAVSGATASSLGFLAALEDALEQARTGR
jgi:uncharacterized protein with FMN-binding domain